MDVHVAVVWMLFSVVATGLCTLACVVLARTASRKNGLHTLVASLLMSRVIFCLSVTSLYAIYIFLEAGWSVLACHALYWLWTVTWVSDIVGVCGGSVWGLVKLRHLQSSFRLGATIAVAGTWLLATTSAGILAYFNRRIKEAAVLEQTGCHVTPLVVEAGLATGVLCVLVVGVLTAVGLLVAFQVRLSKLQSGSQGGPVASHISVDAHSVNGQIAEIRREPSRLEAIEEYCVRPGTSSRRVPGIEEAVRLRDWRNLLCAATGLMLLLNVTPYLVSLCFHILRHTYIPHGDVIILSCHLANSFIFPITMISVSKEYRQALLAILKGRNKGNNGQRKLEGNHDKDAEGRPTEHSRSERENTNLSTNAHHAASTETVTVMVTPHDNQGLTTPDDKQSPQVARSASRLSRAEWKEQMMKSGQLPGGTHSTPAGTGAHSCVRGEQRPADGGTETDTDSDATSTVCDTEVGFHDSDIDRVLSTAGQMVHSVPDTDSSYDARSTSWQSSLERGCVLDQLSDKVSHHERSPTHVVLPPNRRPPRGLGKRKKKQKTKSERHKLEIYATISRALGLENTKEIPSRSTSQSDMVYSSTNPFLQTLQEEAEADTQSERSMEAEIVAITIRGRGSFQRKLKRRGLVPGFMYVTNGGELGVRQEAMRAPAAHHSPAAHCQDSPSRRYMQDTAGPHPTPTSRSTNPFIDDMEETLSTPNTRRHMAASYTREWVTSKQQFQAHDPSPRHSNPFLNYGFQDEELEGLVHEERTKRWSSNPFLQDMVGELLAVHPGTEFVTQSAPASPTLQHRPARPAALAVTAPSPTLQHRTARPAALAVTAPSPTLQHRTARPAALAVTAPSPTLQHRPARPAALAVTAEQLLKSTTDVWARGNINPSPALTKKISENTETYRTEYL